MEARKNASLPRDHREHPRPSDCRSRATAPSMLRGYSWPAPLRTSQPSQEEEKQEEVVEEEEEGEERYGAHEMEVEIGRYHLGVPDSGGSYSSYATRAVAGGVWSLPMGACLSACPQPSPALLRPSRRYRGTQRRHLQDMEALKGRKASVDKNYEWDSTNVSIQPGDQDLGGTSLFSSVSLLKSTPSMHHSRKGLKESVQFQGHHHETSRYSEPEPEKVLF
ncbi:uncharacterized protein LOC118385234 [Oncorhynchus keta]|uniref:uncharacterized protein LOC118385234 n=1 Tax=Oncorhynchus keta TaxID=8018 RepID=UPI0015FAD145|nr:uncharacterized protein LOC118385234 [Oncorhynchus keta]XP_035628092.1 uncharacterized protein LOC118385234 [Oncorhynchus keta]